MIEAIAIIIGLAVGVPLLMAWCALFSIWLGNVIWRIGEKLGWF